MALDSAIIQSRTDLAELLEDAATLADFKHTIYHQVLDKLWQRHLAHLQAYTIAGTRDQFDYNKGRHDGAQELINMPESIIRMAMETKRAAE